MTNDEGLLWLNHATSDWTNPISTSTAWRKRPQGTCTGTDCRCQDHTIQVLLVNKRTKTEQLDVKACGFSCFVFCVFSRFCFKTYLLFLSRFRSKKKLETKVTYYIKLWRNQTDECCETSRSRKPCVHATGAANLKPSPIGLPSLVQKWPWTKFLAKHVKNVSPKSEWWSSIIAVSKRRSRWSVGVNGLSYMAKDPI